MCVLLNFFYQEDAGWQMVAVSIQPDAASVCTLWISLELALVFKEIVATEDFCLVELKC